jgi:hypothetical protein
MRRTFILLLGLSSALMLFYNGCTHKPMDVIPGPGPDTTSCDTNNVTYPGTVYPILQQFCFECHSGPLPIGGYDYTDYSQVAFVASSGKLLGAIRHQDGFSPMPKEKDPLDSCRIRQIEIWVRDTTFVRIGQKFEITLEHLNN